MADDAKNDSSLPGENLPAKCIICNKTESLKRCAKCKGVYYCTREHQIADWKSHKAYCKAKALQAPTSEDTNLSSAPNPDSLDFEPKASIPDKKDQDKDYIDFDERPYKLSEFEKPKANQFFDLSKHIGEHLKEKGFCVVDGILNDDELDNVIKEVKSLDAAGKLYTGKLGGGRSSGDDDQKVVNKDIRSDRIMWLQGDEPDLDCPAILSLLTEKMDMIVGGLNSHIKKKCINGRTKAMIACYPGNGAGYKRHIDNPCKDGRIITCICYLNKNWDPRKDGGFLRIFPETMTDDYVDVSPEANRMLFFWSDGRNPHEVHPAYNTRYAVTVWFFEESERSQAKLAEVEQELASVQERIKSMDEKKKRLEKMTAELEIQNRASQALSALSEEEKDAILTLIEACPDPSSMLSGLGIASYIQAPLIEEAKKRKLKK